MRQRNGDAIEGMIEQAWSLIPEAARGEPDHVRHCLETLVDMSGVGTFNDLVVGPDGTAYLDFCRGIPTQGEILCMTADLHLSTVAVDVSSPNGMGITPDRTRLLVNETGADRITAFAIGKDGALGDRRTFALLRPASGDATAQDRVREAVLQAYVEFEEQAAVAT